MRPAQHPFRPRPPWIGPTLQTIRGVKWPLPLSLPAGHRLWIPLADGDQLAACLHWPRADAPRRPPAVLVHGLAGTEDDPYLRATARALLARGFPVLRLNLRGGAVSRLRSHSHYHIGRSEDLRDALCALPPALTAAGVVVAGWSLGGALVLHLLARHATEAGMPPLLAAAAVCPPLDPAAAHASIDAHPLFGPYLLGAYRREVLAVEGAADLTDLLRVAAAQARSLREFEETVTAPRFGYPSYGAFVELNRADLALPLIRVPTLLLMAADDPLVPADALAGIDWSACPAVAPVLVAGGGHCGFDDLRLVRDNLQARAVAAMFEGAAGDRLALTDAAAPASPAANDHEPPSRTAPAAARAAPA